MPEQLDPTAHLQAMFEDARAFCLQRFNYTPDAYVSPEARERHINNDARDTTQETRFAMPWNAGYARGIAEGLRQATQEAFVDEFATCPSCRTNGPARGSCDDRWHLDNLVGGPNQRFKAAIGELAGLFGAKQGGKTTAARIVKEIYEAGNADGLRQATEGWEREWGTRVGDGPVEGHASERSARKWASGDHGVLVEVVSRLAAGPWEPAEQPEGSDRGH